MSGIKIEKWIDLSGLPRWRYSKGQQNGVIDWMSSIGCIVSFTYEDIIGEFKIIGYDKSKYRLIIQYKNEPPFDISTGDFKKCGIGKLLKKITSDFKIEIGTNLKDDKRDIIIIDRKHVKNKRGQNHKYYKYHCNKCKYKGSILEGNLLNQKNGCGCCSGDIVAEGINDIPTTAPWMIPYFQGGEREARQYTKASTKHIYPICPDCGRVKNKSIPINNIYNRHSISCACGDTGISYPTKLMFSVLEQLGVEFRTEYSPSWIKPRRYDFYFEYNNKKYIIEMDGEQHKKEKSRNSNWCSLGEQIKNDDYKDKLAEEHGIQVIRVDCELSDLDFIKNNILKSELNNIFDLSKIDWLKCEEFAMTNLVKKVCETKRDNPDMSTTDIGEIFNLTGATIRKYLKKGSEIWDWCVYDVKTEICKSSRKSGKMNGKPVQIFKGGVSLGIFPSCSELSRQSKELFGVKLDQSLISWTANGKRKSHHGYTFRYVESQTTDVTTQPNPNKEQSA